jgi:2',3'-cyclic-nucleotide 2'-phosphodiesterase (5'-nucleotidase family)
MLDTKPLSANFMKIGESECFEPYSIVSYGDVKIAYIGITTPGTPKKTSFPSQFSDENGNPVYTFCEDNLADVVQGNIDKARAEGADFVIALSHLGNRESEYNAKTLVSEVVGLDVVLDAHSHSVIESATLIDKNGNEVVYTSTGTKFENIGKLVISGDTITTELIPLASYTEVDPVLEECIEQINAEYSEIGDKKVADSAYNLITHDADGNRIVRTSETNLGNLIADAFRTVLGADIAYFNGGGIRTDIDAGEITYNDLLNVVPFSNTGVVVEVDGATVLKMLNASVAAWPEEAGVFPHVSGITFSFNTLGEAGDRIYNVKILNSETGRYEALDLEAKYTLASINFIVLEGGGGMDMFEDATVINDSGILDIHILESYITDNLGGVIPEDYATYGSRITCTNGIVADSPDVNGGIGGDSQNGDEGTGENSSNVNGETGGNYPYVTDGDHAIWIGAIGLALAIITIITVMIIRKRRM